MFQNLRYVTLLAYGILIILTLIAGVYFKRYTAEHVLKVNATHQAKELAHQYTETIWNRYYPVIGFLADKNNVSYPSYPQYISFKQDSYKLFNSKLLIKAAIYMNNGILYQSNDKEIEQKKNLFQRWFNVDDNLQAQSQLNTLKHPVSSVMPAAYFKDRPTELFSIVRVLVPIEAHGTIAPLKGLEKKAIGVLEINYDITKELKVVETIQYTVVSVIIIFFGIICSTIFLSIQRAEGVIEKQQEASAEMAEARANAEHESKAKSKFLANVSHELRTPLNAIIGFSEIISTEAMGPLNNDQYKDFVKDIHTSGLHLLSLINDILDFSKAEEDKLEVVFEDVDLTKIIKISLRMIMPRAEQSKVTLKEVLPEEHLIMQADGKRLKQVVLNLLSNSVKFTPEGGSITLKAWNNADKNSIIVEISDTGVGMEPQDIARALAPFGQVDNKLSRRYEGTGLGLPLTKKLVELMKGKFEIKSEVGMGTTITISFPLQSKTVGGQLSTAV